MNTVRGAAAVTVRNAKGVGRVAAVHVSRRTYENVSAVIDSGSPVQYCIGRAHAILVASGGDVGWNTKASHDSSVDTTSGNRDCAWRDE